MSYHHHASDHPRGPVCAGGSVATTADLITATAPPTLMREIRDLRRALTQRGIMSAGLRGVF